MLSIFDIFKVGVGPSSSHTNGPMLAATQFRHMLLAQLQQSQLHSIQIHLFGSLALTGIGHHTDRAVVLGLMGHRPDTVDLTQTHAALMMVKQHNKLVIEAHSSCMIHFEWQRDIVFHPDALPLHENGLRFCALDQSGHCFCEETYYSIGGGFVVTEAEFAAKNNTESLVVPYPFHSAQDILTLSANTGLSFKCLVLENEKVRWSMEEIEHKAERIWSVMQATLQRGLKTEGILEGGLQVTRRAPSLLRQLNAQQGLTKDPMITMDWINLFAFAVSEENAAGGQVVTSPTNGAAGVIPAVLMYYHQFIEKIETPQLLGFLAVSAAIGMLYKMNASISGAEVGCQGEIGVSSSMAAAGLTSVQGGSTEQICIAAEIAMEHSLGMTCDPVGGLVQIPCIERNAIGAIKAINASRMAVRRTSKSIVSLDNVIEVMYQTGKDMNAIYRETSLGGLAKCHSSHCANPCE